MDAAKSTANRVGLTVQVVTSPLRVEELERDFSAQLGNAAGAVVSFCGRMRQDANAQPEALFLEHYPGMTERVIAQHLEQVRERFSVQAAQIWHRVGRIGVGEVIVWVVVATMRRQAAFSACSYLMDFLKTEAPLWKKNLGEENSWVGTRTSDTVAHNAWFD